MSHPQKTEHVKACPSTFPGKISRAALYHSLNTSTPAYVRSSYDPKSRLDLWHLLPFPHTSSPQVCWQVTRPWPSWLSFPPFPLSSLFNSKSSSGRSENSPRSQGERGRPLRRGKGLSAPSTAAQRAPAVRRGRGADTFPRQPCPGSRPAG